MNIEARRPIRIGETGEPEPPVRTTVDFVETVVIATGRSAWEIRETEPGVLHVTMLSQDLLATSGRVVPLSVHSFAVTTDPPIVVAKPDHCPPGREGGF